jgi:hypothetical protein
MEKQENLDLKPALKNLTFKPENEIKDLSDNLIKEIELSVVHGTGRASGISWISVELKPESAESMQPDEKIFNKIGLSINEDNKFVLQGGGPEEVVEEDETLLGQIVKALYAYFAEHPTELEGLKNELKKSRQKYLINK